MSFLIATQITVELIETLQLEGPWRYSEIPHALGCDDWFTARVTTCGEFDQALKAAERDVTLNFSYSQST